MIGATEILIIALLIISASGFALKYILHFNIQTNSCIIPLLTAVTGVIASTQLRNFSEAIAFLFAATAQFASFVFVSRLRQRGSFFWHVMASLAANGTWYATMHILKTADAYWMLFIPYIIGIITGRTTGVVWSQYIENKFNLKSDATRDDRLQHGQRVRLIFGEWTFWVLVVILGIYTAYGSLNFETQIFKSLLIVIGLGILQNFFYALNTRASQRGNNWYIAITGVLSGATFVANAAYLFSKNMPMKLLLPYMVSTSLGSATGAILSMIVEWTFQMAPDEHLKKNDEKNTPNLWHDRLPYIVVAGLVVAWIFLQKPIFTYFGHPISPLVFPLPIFETIAIPRAIVIFVTALIFLLDNALHTIVSRAGNRDHTGYHVSACIPKGTVDFFKARYIALNSNIPDIMPVAILAGCLGSLWGKDISEKIEKWLQARMDPVRSSPSGFTS